MRHTLRALLRSPSFSCVAVSCIALGVAVTSTMFSAVYGLFVRALPYPDAGRLVAVREQNLQKNVAGSRISWADFASWRKESRSFEGLGAWSAVFPTLSGDEADVERVEGAWVSSNALEIVGVRPLFGRIFAPAEELRGQERVVVIGYELWRRRFGGDRSAVGRTIQINYTPYVIVGIMPPGFDFPERSQVWLPYAADAARERHGDRQGWVAVGRLKSTVSLAAASADLSAIARRLEAEFPRENLGWDAEVASLRDDLVGSLRRPILILLGAAGLVLLIACVNVANLMLARGEARRTEMAVRIAIGAGRRRVVAETLSETIAVALAGGVAGIGLASLGIRLLALAFPDGVPSYLTFAIDANIAIFTAVVSLVAGTLFGLVPALRASRVDVGALRQGASSGGVAGQRMRSALMIAELAMSLVLLIGATLLIRSDLSIERGLGFDTRGMLSFRVPLPGTKYRGTARRAFVEQLMARVRGVDGVQVVGSSQGLPFGPLGGSYDRARVQIEGRPEPGADEPTSLRQEISADYFRALGAPIVRGRALNATDFGETVATAIVNDAFLKRYLPSSDPLGVRIKALGRDASPPWLTIVGVVANMRQDRPPQSIDPAIYVPFVDSSQTMVVKTALADPLRLAPTIRSIVRELDPTLPMYLVQSVDQMVARTLWRQRLQGEVLGIFASLALALAAFGIYAVVSYAVAQRTRELGVRVALGASRGRIIGFVLVQVLKVAAPGLTIGVVGALALSRLLSSLLYEVRPNDPMTLVGAVAALACVTLLAAAVPARRAARADPLVAIRAE